VGACCAACPSWWCFPEQRIVLTPDISERRDWRNVTWITVR